MPSEGMFAERIERQDVGSGPGCRGLPACRHVAGFRRAPVPDRASDCRVSLPACRPWRVGLPASPEMHPTGPFEAVGNIIRLWEIHVALDGASDGSPPLPRTARTFWTSPTSQSPTSPRRRRKAVVKRGVRRGARRGARRRARIQRKMLLLLRGRLHGSNKGQAI